MKYLNKLTKKLLKSPITIAQYEQILKKSDRFYDSIELETQLLISNGYPIYFSDDYVYLKTTQTSIDNQVFCIVDIETSSGKVQKGQLLEIGAVKYKNGQIIEKYQSLVNCYKVPKKVEELTGISTDMLLDAPSLKTVLEEFKIFLEDDIFVAHNLSFDYNFISDSFEKYDLGRMSNRGLCTIDLLHKTIKAPRYGLQYITEFLDIPIDSHHRAMSDAMATVGVFEKVLLSLPCDVVTSEDLIALSKSDKNINS
jgi:DNA polymerase-3 subunit epsilon